MKLSIIYVHYNAETEILDSIKSIYKNPPSESFEIIVVDNNGSRELMEALQKYTVIYIKSKNIGFGSGCNLGAKKASGKFLLFLNPDTRVKIGAIDSMLSFIKKNPTVGVLGPRMYDGAKHLLPTINSKISPLNALVAYSFLNSLLRNTSIARKFWMIGVNRNQTQFVDVVSGACMLIPAQIFKLVKGFDERFFLYFEEQDICIRIKNEGYEIVFLPKAQIVHLGGKSLSDKEQIKKYFERSRYLYFQKHFGLTTAIFIEVFLRKITVNFFLGICLILISSMVNTYAQDRLMLFIGDAARDYNAAKEMIVSGVPVLVGIPSSVSWLHQGPISVWLIALALKISNFNPVAPAYLFGVLGGLTTGLVFYLGNKLFGRAVGMVAGIFYAFSPMTVVNARMPYHTSLVPLFTIIFFVLLYKSKKNIHLLPALTISLGALLLVELSNIVAALVAFFFLFPQRKYISKKLAIASIATFLIGIFPFILSDFLNGPSYLKFPLWIVNRIRYFFVGMPTERGVSTVAGIWDTYYQQLSGVVIPHIPVLSMAFFCLVMAISLYSYYKGRINQLQLLLLWFLVPIVSFTFHKSPGTAYFGLLYPVIALLSAFVLVKLFTARRALMLVFAYAFINGMLLLANDFFVSTEYAANPMPPTFYSFGTTWRVADEAALSIVNDAKGSFITLIPEGTISLYKTGIEPYKYLIFYHEGKFSNDGVKYLISDKLTGSGKILYDSSYVVAEKHE